MGDRPILFSGRMVRALLDERKSQTRRLLNPQPYSPESIVSYDKISGKWMSCEPSPATGGTRQMDPWRPIRIKTGDRLYVREAWRVARDYDGHSPAKSHKGKPVLPDFAVIAYEADPLRDGVGKLRQAMHMPRWASRLTLTVSDVHVERLQDISEEDAVAEGCFKGKASGRVFASEAAMHLGGVEWANARDWYADLWDSINSEDTWDANPWVVAYTFTVERRNIDAPVPTTCDTCNGSGKEARHQICRDCDEAPTNVAKGGA